MVIYEHQIVASRSLKRPDLVTLGLIELDCPSDTCPLCHHSSYEVHQGDLRRKIEILKGPYKRYQRREDEIFFDLEKKYYECVHCGQEISVLDIQVLIEMVSRMLPPADARRFSMKMMGKFYLDPESIRQVVPLFVDDFELSKDEPFVS